MTKPKPKAVPPEPPSFAVCGVPVPLRPEFVVTLGASHLFNVRVDAIASDRDFLDLVYDLLVKATDDKAALDAGWQLIDDYAEVNAAISSMYEAVAARPTQAPATS